MQAKSFFLLALTTVVAISCSSSKHSKSKLMPGTWQSTPIVIDGDSKDWPSPYPNYDAKALVAYATSNDKENLYITMETGDEKTQMKILKQGMIVSIDTSGHKDGTFHINFPLQNDNDLIPAPKKEEAKHMPGGGVMRNGKGFEEKLKKSAMETNQFSLDGFINCNGGFLVSQSSPCGIKVYVSIDEYKELVWEAVVPFKAIYGKSKITAADKGKPISVCFAVKAFKNPGAKNENANGGMNDGMAGGGMHNSMQGRGGQGRGASRAPSENPNQPLYDNTKTWKQFVLAYQD